MAPVPLRIQISHIKDILQSEANPRKPTGYFPGYKRFAAPGRFVVKQNAIARVNSVRFPVIDGDPVRIKFSRAIRRAWIKWRRLPLRNLIDLAKKFRGGSLIESRFLLHAEYTNGF